MNRPLWPSLLLLLLTACRLTIVPPASGVTATTETPDARSCTRSHPELQLLFNGLHGYCVQYPRAYDVAFINEFQVAFTRGAPTDMGAPRAEIVMSNAEGRTAAEVAADWAARYADGGMELTLFPALVHGVAAVVLDNPQGAAMQRQVFLVQHERLYMLTFTPAMRTLGVPHQQMEELYTTIIHSFRLIL